MTSSRLKRLLRQPETIIAILATIGIGVHLVLRVIDHPVQQWPLYVTLIVGGAPLVFDLLRDILKGRFGADFLAGISIVTAALLGEWLAGAIVVLMLSGGETLEAYAVRRAGSLLEALAKRMPSQAHRSDGDGLEDIPIDAIEIDDRIVVMPHEICPVDGVVVEGHGKMDESYLTGEPYEVSKAPGVEVLSGAINGESALTIRATRLARDSRYARIMEVMDEARQTRPEMRKLADRLGGWYTPLAVAIGVAAWLVSGEPIRFLAVMVIATPCPLLIAIPVAILGAISLAARKAIVVRDPRILEQIDRCRTLILDKTGTLTLGRPELTDAHTAERFDAGRILSLTASAERYSKHPLGAAILRAAKAQGLPLYPATSVAEPPGQGMTAEVDGHQLRITSRNALLDEAHDATDHLPEIQAGLECVVLLDGEYATTFRFHDEPRAEGRSFIEHLDPHHRFERVMLVSGDRRAEVEYLARRVGIEEIHAEKSPEEKVAIVEAETKKAPTLFVGDGINDAPALMAATVGVAFGQANEITTEAAGAVIMEPSLIRLDELFHIASRLRSVALQSAGLGMTLSVGGMVLAALGGLTPVAGAIAQEVIDLVAVLNALRVPFAGDRLTDVDGAPPDTG